MLEYYSLFNQIFKNKNAKLWNPFELFHKVNITLFFIIFNFSAKSISLSILGVQLNDTLSIDMNNDLRIFGNAFLHY